MTGLGGYVLIVWSIWLRHCLDNKQDEFELHWPRIIGTVPSVERKESAEVASRPISNVPLKEKKKKKTR